MPTRAAGHTTAAIKPSQATLAIAQGQRIMPVGEGLVSRQCLILKQYFHCLGLESYALGPDIQCLGLVLALTVLATKQFKTSGNASTGSRAAVLSQR